MLKYIFFLFAFTLSSAYSQSNFEWKTTFGGNYNAGSDPVDCVMDESGNFYLIGYEVGPVVTETSLLNIYTIKVSPGGTILWKKSYGRSGYYDDTPYSICLDDAGNVFVLGTTPDSSTQTRLGVIIKYSNDGTFIWDKKFNLYNGGASPLKIVYYNSRLYTASNYRIYDSTTSYYTGSVVMFSAITGDSLSSLSGPANFLGVRDFWLDKRGGLYVNWIKDSWPSGYRNYFSKYDNNLNIKWSTTLDTTTSYLSFSIDNNSNTYLSGTRWIFLSGGMINSVKIDSAGNLKWTREYIGSINSYIVKNIIDNENNLLVLGTSRSSSFSDSNNYALIKYSSAGDSLWVKKEMTSIREFSGYPRPMLDFGIDLQNNVYIFANIYPQAAVNERFSITKYSSSGSLLKRVYNNNFINYWSVELFRVDGTGICYIAGTFNPTPNSREFTYVAKINGTVGINNFSNILEKEFSLQQNYPNPFNSSTQIKFSIPKSGNVKIVMYDITGRELQTVTDKYYSEGIQSINFDANKLSSGVYFYKIIYENNSISKTMVLTK